MSSSTHIIACGRDASQNVTRPLAVDTTGQLNVTPTALDTLVNYGGAGNNNSIGDGTVRLQTYCYGHDAANGKMKALKLDSSGRLEVATPAIEVHADTINLLTDDLETAVGGVNTTLGTTNSNLEHISDNLDALDSTLTDGSQKTLLVGANDVSGGTPHRHLTIDSNGRLKVVTHYGATIANQVTAVANSNTPTYEDETHNTANLLSSPSNTGTSIDMLGYRNLVIKLRMSGDTGLGNINTNIYTYFPLDDADFTIGDNISLKEYGSATGNYQGTKRIHDCGFRYVRLYSHDTQGNPTAYTCSFSRSN